MLQEASSSLTQLIADTYNDILEGTGAPPDEWNKYRIIVLYEKDDLTLPDKYTILMFCSARSAQFWHAHASTRKTGKI